MNIEVARVGSADPRDDVPAHGMIPVSLSDAEAQLPWSARPRVALRVTDEHSLAAILDEAALSLGLVENTDWTLGWGTGRFLAFRADESAVPFEDRFQRWLTILDQEGRAVWDAWDFTLIRFKQVRDAAEVGAIEGDPTQIYLNVRLVPAGGGVLAEWQLFSQAWEAAWYVLERSAAIWGAFELYRGARERLRGRHSVDRHAQDWLTRNGWPANIFKLLDRRTWTARNLAGVLGCTTPEAEDILRLYGYSPAPTSNDWHCTAGAYPGAEALDHSAQLVRDFVREVMWRYSDSDVSDETLQDLFRELFEKLPPNGAP